MFIYVSVAVSVVVLFGKLIEAALRKKCPYSELFWSVVSRIRTEYGELLRISPHSVRIRENTVQNCIIFSTIHHHTFYYKIILKLEVNIISCHRSYYLRHVFKGTLFPSEKQPFPGCLVNNIFGNFGEKNSDGAQDQKS